MNITVIGAGNIGGALVRGWSKRGKDISLTVSGVHIEKLNKIKDDCPNIEILTDDAQATKVADIIIIAVKPWQVETVISDIKDNLKSSQILVSLAAGVTLEQLSTMLNAHQCEQPSLFYVIPNIAAEYRPSPH